MPDTLQSDWQALQLGSGIDVPAVVTLAALGQGLAGGQSVRGFAVDFDWLGAGLPQAQPFVVYDAQTFDIQYSGQTTSVPLPSTVRLLLTAFLALGGYVTLGKRSPVVTRLL